MRQEYIIWRVWLKREGTSLHELKYEWSYEDILKANAILDRQDDYETAYRELDKQDFDRKHKK